MADRGSSVSNQEVMAGHNVEVIDYAAFNSPVDETASSSVGNGALGSVGNGALGSVGNGALGSVGNGALGSVGNGALGSVGNGVSSSVGNGGVFRKRVRRGPYVVKMKGNFPKQIIKTTLLPPPDTVTPMEENDLAEEKLGFHVTTVAMHTTSPSFASGFCNITTNLPTPSTSSASSYTGSLCPPNKPEILVITLSDDEDEEFAEGNSSVTSAAETHPDYTERVIKTEDDKEEEQNAQERNICRISSVVSLSTRDCSTMTELTGADIDDAARDREKLMALREHLYSLDSQLVPVDPHLSDTEAEFKAVHDRNLELEAELATYKKPMSTSEKLKRWIRIIKRDQALNQQLEFSQEDV